MTRIVLARTGKGLAPVPAGGTGGSTSALDGTKPKTEAGTLCALAAAAAAAARCTILSTVDTEHYRFGVEVKPQGHRKSM
jgi:hypothetical protein